MTSGNLYVYLDSIDPLIIQPTAYSMAKVEDEFMALSPRRSGEYPTLFEGGAFQNGEKSRQEMPLMDMLWQMCCMLKKIFPCMRKQIKKQAEQDEEDKK